MGIRPKEDAMRGTRFTQEQIVSVLQEHEAGVATPALCRQHGISEQTFYRWKQKYGGLERGEATRLKVLEEENTRLKRLVAEQALDNQILKDLLRKNA
jgi:putative transposase